MPRNMSDVTISIRPGGPYLVRGPIQLLDAEGNEIPDASGKQNIALCRCGASTNKPFCDGTHSAIGFQAAERAVEEQG
jgi:CDGSH-type Zn-finger protein